MGFPGMPRAGQAPHLRCRLAIGGTAANGMCGMNPAPTWWELFGIAANGTALRADATTNDRAPPGSGVARAG